MQVTADLMAQMQSKICEALETSTCSVSDVYGDGRHVSIDVVSPLFEVRADEGVCVRCTDEQRRPVASPALIRVNSYVFVLSGSLASACCLRLRGRGA
jgi:hypothetical protein